MYFKGLFFKTYSIRYNSIKRSISLMNVDGKIASKAIATRLKVVIQKLIHHNQTAYVGNRYIREANRLVSDILEFTVEKRWRQFCFQQISKTPWTKLNILSFLQP